MVRVVPFDHGQMAADLAPYLEPDEESIIEVYVCPCQGFSACSEATLIEHRLRSCSRQTDLGEDPGCAARRSSPR